MLVRTSVDLCVDINSTTLQPVRRLGLQFSYSITLWNRPTIRTETVRSIFNFLFSLLYIIFSETSFEAHKDFFNVIGNT